MPPLTYLEEYEDKEDNTPPVQQRGPHEALRNPPSSDTTSEHRPPSEKPTKEPTLEPKPDASSDPSATKREGYTGHLAPGDMTR